MQKGRLKTGKTGFQTAFKRFKRLPRALRLIGRKRLPLRFA